MWQNERVKNFSPLVLELVVNICPLPDFFLTLWSIVIYLIFIHPLFWTAYFLTVPLSLQDLTSPTGNQTCAPCIGSEELPGHHSETAKS